jgi:hypothetical protein
VPGTIIVTDYVFGDLDAECAALAEIGYELEQAPASVKDAAAVLVCLRPGVRGCRGVGCRGVGGGGRLPNHRPPLLRTHSRAIVTRHMSFYSAEAQDEQQRRAVEEVVRALTDREPRCPVNPEVLGRV